MVKHYVIITAIRSVGIGFDDSIDLFQFFTYLLVLSPNYTEMYEETIDMYDKSIEVLFAKRDNDPRVYANFIYDDSMVIICCSEENIESGFLNEFGLGNLKLKQIIHKESKFLKINILMRQVISHFEYCFIY